MKHIIEKRSFPLLLDRSSRMTGACFMQLVAQAEAEKRNIGQADYIHREYDHAKKVQEEKEKHRIEINKYASCDLCTRNTEAIT